MTSTDSRPSWLSLLFPPERFEPLEIRLAGNVTQRAVWTGAKWWSDGQEVQPEAWRPLNPELQEVAV